MPSNIDEVGPRNFGGLVNHNADPLPLFFISVDSE
jgi:hypothetical protein